MESPNIYRDMLNKRDVQGLAKRCGLKSFLMERGDAPFVRVESGHGSGPRGSYYHYALLSTDGKLVALGEEQGNYAGGEYAFAPGAEPRGFAFPRRIDLAAIEELPSELSGFLKSIGATKGL
jgi:hypothetical protein